MKVTDVCKSFLLTFFYSSVIKQVVTFPFCSKSHATPNSTVHFVTKHDLVPEINGCVLKCLSLKCCMADYVAVKWFQKTKDGWWKDFLNNTIERELGEDDNQTAILKSAYDHDIDNATYKCVGYGIRPGDVIEHTMNVTLRECPNMEQAPPFPFLPYKEESKQSMKLSADVTVTCGAIFGLECSTSSAQPDCTFQWEKTGEHGGKIPAGNSTSGLRVYYENSGTATNVNDLTSVLYVNQSEDSDYGTYICKMENTFGKSDRKITLTQIDVIHNLLPNGLVSAIVISVTLLFIILVVGYRFRWHLRIRFNEVKQKMVRHRGDELRHDVLLLHTSSVTVDTSFARYCKRKLEQLNYSVIVEDDITGGENAISEWLKWSDESQYTVIILSPDFFTDEDQTCRLPLLEIIRTKANFLFVLFRFTSEKQIVAKTRDLKAAIQLKPKIRLSVDTTSFDGNDDIYWELLESSSANEFGAFWKKLTSHLSGPIQTENAALRSEVRNSEVSPLLDACVS